LDVKDIISSGLLELYAAGLCSEAESIEVLSYLEKYPELVRALHEIEDIIEAYAIAQAIQPNASVKDKIFAQIDSSEATKTGQEFSQPATAIVTEIPQPFY
jgi:hypothetical protein